MDGYRDGYNATVEEAQMTKAYDGTTSVLLGGQIDKGVCWMIWYRLLRRYIEAPGYDYMSIGK